MFRLFTVRPLVDRYMNVVYSNVTVFALILSARAPMPRSGVISAIKLMVFHDQLARGIPICLRSLIEPLLRFLPWYRLISTVLRRVNDLLLFIGELWFVLVPAFFVTGLAVACFWWLTALTVPLFAVLTLIAVLATLSLVFGLILAV